MLWRDTKHQYFCQMNNIGNDIVTITGTTPGNRVAKARGFEEFLTGDKDIS